jgi:hypothetical protein
MDNQHVGNQEYTVQLHIVLQEYNLKPTCRFTKFSGSALHFAPCRYTSVTLPMAGGDHISLFFILHTPMHAHTRMHMRTRTPFYYWSVGPKFQMVHNLGFQQESKKRLGTTALKYNLYHHHLHTTLHKEYICTLDGI